MTDNVHGSHHVTTVASDPTENAAFRADALGLPSRLGDDGDRIERRFGEPTDPALRGAE